jgi:hypothetical protein
MLGEGLLAIAPPAASFSFAHGSMASLHSRAEARRWRMSTFGSLFSSMASVWRRVRARSPVDPGKWDLMNIGGAVGVALVDYDSGMSLGTSGGGDWLNLEVAAAGTPRSCGRNSG